MGKVDGAEPLPLADCVGEGVQTAEGLLCGERRDAIGKVNVADAFFLSELHQSFADDNGGTVSNCTGAQRNGGVGVFREWGDDLLGLLAGEDVAAVGAVQEGEGVCSKGGSGGGGRGHGGRGRGDGED